MFTESPFNADVVVGKEVRFGSSDRRTGHRTEDTEGNGGHGGVLTVGRIIGQFVAPKGLDDSAQGFNPGNHPIKRFALKGREIIRWWERVVSVYGLGHLSGRMVVLWRFPGLSLEALTLELSSK
jgi:hypothetical protein